MEEKLRWTFSLYDINGDGFITQEEMIDIATAVYELMGRSPEIPTNGPDPDQIKEKVEKIFSVSFQQPTFFNFTLFKFLQQQMNVIHGFTICSIFMTFVYFRKWI